MDSHELIDLRVPVLVLAVFSILVEISFVLVLTLVPVAPVPVHRRAFRLVLSCNSHSLWVAMGLFVDAYRPLARFGLFDNDVC